MPHGSVDPDPKAQAQAAVTSSANPPEDALKPPVSSTAGQVASLAAKMIKPSNDDMSYRYLVLPNDLRALLVSDPTTDKAGAAMDVCVGSMCDPEDFPGLAHFTEHMLFYSSAKYPVEDEYTKFISDRGGTTNAYTSAEHTNYHFDVNWESLEGALDRFAQFFIAPTISEDGIEREVRAVDSEHGKNLSSDAWRKSQVNKATANRQHPWTRFSTGNRETLFSKPLAAGADPRGAVVDFHSRHYSANRCALAVLGRQPLDELEAMVRSQFSEVPNQRLPRPAFKEEVFLPEQVGVMLRVVPIRDGQSLELVWQVPSSERLYREQPLGYLSHLLGHEGEGSVFALLKSRGLASALVSGETGGALTFASFFTVHVELTEEGQRNIREVAATVFRYLDLLRQPEGICERIWGEVRGLAQLHFDTRDKSKPITYCTDLAGGMQAYPAEDLLPAMYSVPRDFSPAAIREALDLLTADRVRVFWISKTHLETPATPATPAPAPGDKDTGSSADSGTGGGGGAAEGDSKAAGGAAAATIVTGAEFGELITEPIYGTRYGVSQLPADWLSAWVAARHDDEPRLHLPAPNRFIPTDLSLVAEEAKAAGPHPQVVLAVPGRLRLWHKPDTRFGQPKAVLYLDIQTPEAYTSPRAAVLTRLFVKLMLDYLNEVAYPAQQAGLDYNVLNTQFGWQLMLGGYNHKLPELLSEVLDRLAGFKVLPDRFEFVREGLVREYANQLHNQPYSWAMYRGEMLTTFRRWPIEVYGSHAAAVTVDELSAFVANRLNSRCFVEGLAAGNMGRAEALRCGGMLLMCLRDRCGAAPLHPAELPDLRVLKIDAIDNGDDGSNGKSQPSTEAAAAAETGGEEKMVEAKEEEAEEEGGAGVCGGGWLFVEDVPNDQDENSAAVVQYQVGPDHLRRNALRALLVQLAKRDAFSELRTRQQLGYIVSLHAGAEHGVGYLEVLVQSNSHSADELCRRMDEFLDRFLSTDLPAKWGAQQPPADSEAAVEENDGQQEGQEAGGKQAAATAAAVPEPTEFAMAVEELAKTKLEKPKKLAELASRWWNEVHEGCYRFDRREAEVAELRSITPEELQAFALELLTGAGASGPVPLRKLSIQIRGKAEYARAAAPASTLEPPAAAAVAPEPASPATAAAPTATGGETTTTDAAAAAAAPQAQARRLRRRPYTPIPFSDPFSWKRSLEAWPSVRALWAARRSGAAAAGAVVLPSSVAEEEVEGLLVEAAKAAVKEVEKAGSGPEKAAA